MTARVRRAVALLVLVLLAAASSPGQDAQQARLPVGILKSPATLAVQGEKGAFDFGEACRMLDDLGVRYVVIDEDALCPSGTGGIFSFRPACDLIILPDTRCMRQSTAATLRAFVKEGGKLLATSMASYRNENNEKAGDRNDFQLADLLGVHYLRWVSGAPKAEYLARRTPPGDERLAALTAALPASIQLGRNTAMLVQPDEGAIVAADWRDAGKPDTQTDASRPAIVVSGDRSCVYVGENLFCAENAQSVEVKALTAALLNYLVEGTAPLPPPPRALKGSPAFFPPVRPRPVPPASGPTVRVGLSSTLAEFHVSAEGSYRLAPDGGAPVQCARGAILRLACVSDRILACDSEGRTVAQAQKKLTLTPDSQELFLGLIFLKGNGTFSSRLLRGALEVSARGGKLALVDCLPLEQYVAGVVPREVPLTYPPEAQKAMAVIARTFALSNLARHRKDDFHLCPSVHCQVFDGVAAEAPAPTQAVIDTAGEVVTFRGKYANTVFHACCAGVGENVERIWSGSKGVPYLTGAPDTDGAPACDLSSEESARSFLTEPCPSFCSASAKFRWQESHSLSEMEGLLRESLPVLLKGGWRDFGKLVDLAVVERSTLGRVQRLEIVGTDRTLAVEKDSIRWIFNKGRVGTGGLASTLFVIEREGAGDESVFTFRGGGWGHGVGMCQEGARGRAIAGRDYRAIIRHYYPGTLVEKR